MARRYRLSRFGLCLITLGLLAWAHSQFWRRTGRATTQTKGVIGHRVLASNYTTMPRAWNAKTAIGRRCTAFPDASAELSALIMYLLEDGGIIELRDSSESICAEQLVGYSVGTAADRQALRHLEKEASELYPLVLIGSQDDHQWRQIKAIMSLHDVQPELALVDISRRPDREVVLRSIARLSGSSRLPQLLLRGRLLGGYDIVKEMVRGDSLIGFLKGNGVTAERSDPYLLGSVMGLWKYG